MGMHFDFTDMRLLTYIAEMHSLTAGAKRACLSLPAASSRLKRFEDSLGLKLFHRTTQGLTLTPGGDVVLRYSREVNQQLERMRCELNQFVRGIKGTLRLQANTIATTDFVPSILPAFLATHPDVEVDLQERLSPEIVRAVCDGRADIGIVAGDISAEGLEVIPYREDRLVLVTSPDHELAGLDEVAYLQTLKYEHVCPFEGSALSNLLSQMADDGHRALRSRIRVGNFEAACRIVEANVAVGIVPESSARRYEKSMRICLTRLSDPWSVNRMSICVKNIGEIPSFGRDLINMMLADLALAAES